MNSDVRSTGASRKASNPPSSRSATNSRFIPSTAANSSVTHSTPLARSPASVSRSSPKRKSTNVDSENRNIDGTDSRVRSSSRRSLRMRAETAFTRAPSPGP